MTKIVRASCCGSSIIINKYALYLVSIGRPVCKICNHPMDIVSIKWNDGGWVSDVAIQKKSAFYKKMKRNRMRRHFHDHDKGTGRSSGAG